MRQNDTFFFFLNASWGPILTKKIVKKKILCGETWQYAPMFDPKFDLFGALPDRKVPRAQIFFFFFLAQYGV